MPELLFSSASTTIVEVGIHLRELYPYASVVNTIPYASVVDTIPYASVVDTIPYASVVDTIPSTLAWP
jgi:hypothetical protein